MIEQNLDKNLFENGFIIMTLLIAFGVYYTLSIFRTDENIKLMDRKISFALLLITLIYTSIVIIFKYVL